jgi:hypothetical protein
MKFLRKFGFRKSDEMETLNALIAVRTSWIVIIIALLIWSLYDFFVDQILSPAFLLLSVGLMIYFLITLYMSSESGSGNPE